MCARRIWGCESIVIADQRVARMRARMTAPRSNPAAATEESLDCFASLAMTAVEILKFRYTLLVTPGATLHLLADDQMQYPPRRHCERSEAIQFFAMEEGPFASLAMTKRGYWPFDGYVC